MPLPFPLKISKKMYVIFHSVVPEYSHLRNGGMIRLFGLMWWVLELKSRVLHEFSVHSATGLHPVLHMAFCNGLWLSFQYRVNEWWFLDSW